MSVLEEALIGFAQPSGPYDVRRQVCRAASRALREHRADMATLDREIARFVKGVAVATTSSRWSLNYVRGRCSGRRYRSPSPPTKPDPLASTGNRIEQALRDSDRGACCSPPTTSRAVNCRVEHLLVVRSDSSRTTTSTDSVES